MKQSSQKGFTLVELMVVIVIVSIVASLILVNMDSIDHRKVMQAREVLIMDLQRVARESQDQSKILALSLNPSIENNNYQYKIVEYIPFEKSSKKPLIQLDQQWLFYKEFKARELPNDVYVQITPTQYIFENAGNQDLLNDRAPKLIWLGNGEVKPVTIQFYHRHKPIGAEIKIDYLGKIHAS